ncbi:podocalyxin [Labrus mixtus]|uniref:podocalyxin n=1 Tax=Labrus mixtus TaxID=508554 RepID=UPI0029BFCEEF|nr:podocalyxin [Labrus mixtus]
MRATLRITWLLLLLSTSFLFHIVSANADAQNITSATNNNTDSTAATKATTDAPTSITVAPSANLTQMSTNTTAVFVDVNKMATTPAVTVTTTAKPTDKPGSIQPAATIVPNNQPATTTISLSTGSTTQLNNTSTTLSPAVTTDSSSVGGSVVSSSAPIVQTTKPSGFSGVSPSTGSPVTQPGGPGSVGTTNPARISTGAPGPGQPATSHTTITSRMSQQGGGGGSEKMTTTMTNQQPTASKDPGPVGNTGTSSSPPTLTKAGPLAGGTSGTRAGTTAPQIPTTFDTTSVAQLKTFVYSLNTGQEKDEKHELVEVCKRLMVNLQDGNCTLTWRHHNDRVQFDCVEINGKVKTNLATQIYEEINKKPTDNKTLIAILASCGALLIMIVILAVCASHHRKPYNENQQHLTEELHTVENGYHDNPTLEVMEVQPEMQEKKMALNNGEFNDSWIVPIDNLLKDDMPDEEDTHL